MTDYREDVYVKCPYYCKERALDIRYKGMIGLLLLCAACVKVSSKCSRWEEDNNDSL